MLEVKNLHARIGEKEILKGIDLVINDGRHMPSWDLTVLVNPR